MNRQVLLYYILNREIQELLVEVKMTFLRSLKVFISSREINLYRLDTFPIMVRNKSSMYNRYRLLGPLKIPFCSCSYTQVSNRHKLPFTIVRNKQMLATEMVNFMSKPEVFFRGVQLNDEFVHFIWHGTAPNKSSLSVMNLRSPGPAAGQAVTVKVKCRLPFSEPVQGLLWDSLVLFKTKWRP